MGTNTASKITTTSNYVRKQLGTTTNNHAYDHFRPAPIPTPTDGQQPTFNPTIKTKHAYRLLKSLDASSSTGSDDIPTRILKHCASSLATPVAFIARRIIASSHWPSNWCMHWITPILKRGSPSNPANYRGVHLTTQLSKVVERMLSRLFLPQLTASFAFGRHQFAYIKEVGTRDAILFLLLSWLSALQRNQRIGLFCSDVSGAFDRVSTSHLQHCINHHRIPPYIKRVLASWLRPRTAVVNVAGASSTSIRMQDMVYQGTTS